MLLKPDIRDIKVILYYVGRIIFCLSFTMLIPAVVGLFLGEINPCFDFVIGAAIAFIVSFIVTRVCFISQEIDWMHAMVAVALAWLAAMVFSAVPLYLGGHFKSFLDACFETMSGFTTTGLSLVQDLDHLSYAHNLWRHLGPFIGGQGITIVALSVLVAGGTGAIKLYVGEARDEKITPNIIHASRIIWLISVVYLILGTCILGVVGISLGMKPLNAFFHGACIFMAGFDTAGFAPQSQNILYYHSFAYEIVVIVFMVIGALNFNLHYQVMKGNGKEIFKNIETKVFLISIMLAFFLVAAGLQQSGIYPQALNLFRKGGFQLLSGHTTTGYMTIYARQFITDWGNLALAGLIAAMACGGCICSTAGGIKMLRIGIAFHALQQDIKKILLPQRAVFVQKFHHIREVFVNDVQVRSALTIILLYLVLYILGAIVGMFYGYPFLESLFESTSAAANVGLSCGITDVTMPAGMKITYIIQMWAGRLEFVAIVALAGFILAFFEGK